MALTSTDETDLLLPLFGGALEQQKFATFLERVRRRTLADYAGLFFRQGELGIHQVTEFHAGRDLRAEALARGLAGLDLLDRFPFERLRPGRVYAVSEFADIDPDYAAFRGSYIAALGIVDERIVRIALDGGVSAWLLLARGAECSAADAALLASLAPYVGMALRTFLAEERARIALAMDGAALERSGAGWLLLDREARLVAVQPGLPARLAARGRFALRLGERLGLPDAAAERTLAQTAALYARDPGAAPRTLELCGAPRIDALLRPSSLRPAAASALPVLELLCRLPMALPPDLGELLAQSSGLSPREGELALRLAQGSSIAEAGEAMGLTLETARNYSKRIYAQLGLRGQAELVRYVLESGASLG